MTASGTGCGFLGFTPCLHLRQPLQSESMTIEYDFIRGTRGSWTSASTLLLTTVLGCSTSFSGKGDPRDEDTEASGGDTSELGEHSGGAIGDSGTGGKVISGGGGTSDGGADANPSNGGADGNTSDGGADANPSGGTDGGGGTTSAGGSVTIGDECTDGDPDRCAAYDQQDILRCTQGEWEIAQSCTTGSQCDSSNGECEEVVEECGSLEPEDVFCDPNGNISMCGVDRVTVDLLKSCISGCEQATATCIGTCADENGGCDPLVSCTEDEDGVACGACPSGYVGDGESGCAPLLLDLAVTNQALSPAFDGEIVSYQLTVPLNIETVTINASTVEGADILANGEIAFVSGATWTTPLLNWGVNTFEVVARSPSGPSSTYQVRLTRGDETELQGSNTQASDYFGNAVALSADDLTVVVGAYGEGSSNGDPNDNSADVAGAAYIFVRENESWVQQAYLKSPAPDEWDFFGSNVAISGNGSVVAIGATSDDSGSLVDPSDNSLDSAGAVFVFQRTGTTWTDATYLKEAIPANYRDFGSGLALSADGSTLAVGVTDNGLGFGVGTTPGGTGATYSGGVYVYKKSGSAWNEQAFIKASNTGTTDEFGTTISLSANGNTMAVGAFREQSLSTTDQDNNDGEYVGAVYIFGRTSDTWSQRAYLKASNPGNGDYFGLTLDLSSDGLTLAVGALYESGGASGINGYELDDSVDEAGAVYLFTKNGVNWNQQAYIKASNPQATDRFGAAVALSGDGSTLLCGASGEDSSSGGFDGDESSNAMSNAGAVYVYRRSGEDWAQVNYLKAESPGFSDYFGDALDLSDDALTMAIGAYAGDLLYLY